MSGSKYRPPPSRPPSHMAEIPVSRITPKSDPLKSVSQHRGSLSTGILPKVPIKPAAPLTPEHHDAGPRDTEPKVCESCELHKSPIWNCAYCGMNFCDPCWVVQGPHKAGRTGPDGLPHEKANPAIVRRLKDILTPPKDLGGQATLHVEDEDTTWFGIARDSQQRPIFQDYGRYSAIMVDSNSGQYKVRYPQLVSFIGQTGAGKSTLIKMLIDQQERLHPTREWGFPSPVAGSTSNSGVPTSGDVHLYSDPNSYAGEHPMLYADCEGLEGGENTPMAVQYRNMASGPQGRSKDHATQRDSRKRRKLSKSLHYTQREIKWANSQDTLKRQYAVTELYPRLLYTFSDVIVFVLRNSNTFESTVLSLLITWASSSLEKSLNQPALPHAVIALNATDTKVEKGEWDPENATKSLMSKVAGAVDRDPTYRDLKSYWERHGKRIRTMKDLLECYYSSITVVRIPGEGRYMMIDEQVSKLYKVISRRCTDSFNAKRRSRWLSNSESLNVYLQCAFDHFVQDLHTPFNFMDISFKINPIPLDFGGNIFKLAVAMKNRFSEPVELFRRLSFMVSSCILLDVVRQGLKGPIVQILEKQYLEHCDAALEDFCAIFSTCTFRNRRGERCVNVKDRHTKGHQNQRGSIIGAGFYEATFTFDGFADDWFRYLKETVSQFQEKLESAMLPSRAADELEIITKLHLSNVNKFYHHAGGAQVFLSNSSCFCCLRELAEHPLPCGHVLCTPCIKGYGQPHRELSASYEMSSCPLHEIHTVFKAPWQVYFKPPLAGVRVLSLDGGGMRGIIILEVLRQVQAELGGRIPVQDFFDLIVGTSTGGILALALGVKGWSVSECQKLFLKLVEKAFTPKFLGGVSFGTTKYRALPLEEALADTFKDEALFGGVSRSHISCTRKVAVTSATETGEQAVIFTNYNRADDEQIGYQLIRSDDPKSDLLIREAARATSAAPTFFKPFRNSRTREGFLDGAIFHNNPVRIANYESKLLWPDVEDCHPDILLSIGTGRHEAGSENPYDDTHADRRRLQVRKVFNHAKPALKEKHSIPGWRGFGEVESWIGIFKKRVESVLDPELTWQEFQKDVVGNSSPIAAERYIRINPRTISRTPKMDDKTQINSLHDEIRTTLSKDDYRMKIEKITHRLIASSFYFEKAGPARESGAHVTIQGNIVCRFSGGSDNLRSLGYYMRKHQRPNFQPFLVVQEINRSESAQEILITARIIDDMINRGLFRLDSIAIPVSSESSLLSMDLHLTDDRMKPHICCGFPISGFPRSLADGEHLKRTTTPSSPNPERPKLSNRRQSLREKRSHATARPASDSNIEYASQRQTQNTSTTSSSRSLDPTFPETADDVPDWLRRRNEVSRPPPRPVHPLPGSEQYYISQPSEYGIQELDAGPASSLDPDDEVFVRAVEQRQGHNDFEIPRILTTEADDDLAHAIERSQHEMRPSLSRTDTGTYEEQLALALSLSLQDR
ncbi:hypothetical protein P154DRAFT_565860 [Amniculicola lignicola CBS 123094]|uniref:FabD/lysophospholipase-like protein n=1 Tax=Amniculicola lignicola CBS 123094 TaxID=1392246 RepID=A0A6A5W9I6_9PLEO|nr:hypothetical protein P154DRAFT_565860 [Amniculicola lignicola CBS 123094]